MAMEEVAAVCLAAGMRAWPAVTAVAIAWAESGGNAYAVNVNDANPQSEAYLSLDLGIWQTNTYWHPEVPIAEALDPVQQIMHVRRIAERVGVYGWVSYVWTPWNTFTAGAYAKFVTPAVGAVRSAGGAL